MHILYCTVLRIQIRYLFGTWIRDPVPFWPLDPGSGMGKNQESDQGSGMNIPDHISESSEIIKFFVRIWDPGWIYSDPGWRKFGTGLRD
jgi:hypothetical protein